MAHERSDVGSALPDEGAIYTQRYLQDSPVVDCTEAMMLTGVREPSTATMGGISNSNSLLKQAVCSARSLASSQNLVVGGQKSVRATFTAPKPIQLPL